MQWFGRGAADKEVDVAVEDAIDGRGGPGGEGSAAEDAGLSSVEMDDAEAVSVATAQLSEEMASFEADGPGALDFSVLGPLASEMEGGAGDRSSDLIAVAMALLDDGTPDRPASRGSQADRPPTRSTGGSAASTRLSARLPGETADDEEGGGSQEVEERRGLLSALSQPSQRGSTARTERSAADVSHRPRSQRPISYSSVLDCLVHQSLSRSPRRGVLL